MRTNDALEALRSAASQLNSRPAAPGSDCPRAGGSGEQPAAAERSNAQVLLQISCLHKAFLGLSDAFLEEQAQRQAERQEAAAAAASVQHLRAAQGQAAATQAQLAQRCAGLEEEVARLRLQLEDRAGEAAEAVASRLDAAVAAAVERAVQQRLAEALPPLLQPLQEAVAATAELAAGAATEAAGLAGQLQQLSQRCGRLEKHIPDVQPALQQQVHALQAGHARLDAALSGLQQQQRQQQQQEEQEQWRSPREQCAAAADAAAVQEQVEAVAAHLAQHAQTTDSLVQSVLADVTAVARHTKQLDREMRLLRREAAQTQAGLLHSCSTFGRALGVPSPVGPFTSLPPQL